jgi:cellobiose phosphorylase
VPATALLGRGKRGLELNRRSWRRTSAERRRIQRGGWTWYTGPASWLYRVGVEAILGFHKPGDRLWIDPCVAPDWRRYELTYRHRSAIYHIVVENAAGTDEPRRACRCGTRVCQARWRDHAHGRPKTHEVRVELG